MSTCQSFQKAKHPHRQEVLKQMKTPLFLAFAVLLFSLSETNVSGQTPDPNFQLYLLIGQSNMAGRGTVDLESKQTDSRVEMLTKELTWKPAADPLHFDKSAAGVGPGLSFGKEMAKANPKVRIGLIPCAVGGTSIQVWAPGMLDAATKTHPYDDMLRRVKEAQKTGVLTGIIWHQGESDRSSKVDYGQSLADLIKLLRKDLNSPDVPFVAGELTSFNPDGLNVGKKSKFNEVVQGLATKVKNYACVSGEGLKDKGDRLHYDTASARILGTRYAEKMIELQKNTGIAH